jgi:hypothetical protein
VLLQTRVDYAPAGVNLSASLIDMDDNKLILGDQVSGKESEVQQLQNTLAVNIVRKLRGEPTDEEMKSLQKIQADDEYKKQMAELARLQASEKDRMAKEAEKKGVTVAEIAKEEVKKKEEAKAAPPPAPPKKEPEAVIAKDSGTTSSNEYVPTFEVGLRSALRAADPNDNHHLGGGFMFTWQAYANRHLRLATVFDLESTRWTSGRNDASNRDQVAYYGAGIDVTVPIAFNGTGLFLGAEATYGLLQSSTAASTGVARDFVLQLMPHAGVGLAWRGVGLFADAGWRLQFLRDDKTSGKAGVDGLVLQGGVRIDMADNRDRSSTWDVGYLARIYTPNGSAIYKGFGGLPLVGGSSGGALLGHELTIMGHGHGARWDHGLSVLYMGNGENGGSGSLKVYEVSYGVFWHAFETEQVLNPYLGGRVGFDYISVATGDAKANGKAGWAGALSAGLDLNLGDTFVVRGGFSYDGHANDNSTGDGTLSGYAVEAGLVVRL